MKNIKENIPTSDDGSSLKLLAGGLSDDFNNILTVILGACSLIDMDDAANSELRRSVSLIKTSAEHAATLTDRLALMSGIRSKSMFKNDEKTSNIQ